MKATQTTEQAITEKQQQVTEKQAIVDQNNKLLTLRKRKDTIDQSVKDQQAVVDQNKDALDQSQQAVTDQQAVVDEAKKSWMKQHLQPLKSQRPWLRIHKQLMTNKSRGSSSNRR